MYINTIYTYIHIRVRMYLRLMPTQPCLRFGATHCPLADAAHATVCRGPAFKPPIRPQRKRDVLFPSLAGKGWRWVYPMGSELIPPALVCNLLRPLITTLFLLVPCGYITVKLKIIPKEMTVVKGALQQKTLRV